jgi:hypothetical protein
MMNAYAPPKHHTLYVSPLAKGSSRVIAGKQPLSPGALGIHNKAEQVPFSLILPSQMEQHMIRYQFSSRKAKFWSTFSTGMERGRPRHAARQWKFAMRNFI